MTPSDANKMSDCPEGHQWHDAVHGEICAACLITRRTMTGPALPDKKDFAIPGTQDSSFRQGWESGWDAGMANAVTFIRSWQKRYPKEIFGDNVAVNTIGHMSGNLIFELTKEADHQRRAAIPPGEHGANDAGFPFIGCFCNNCYSSRVVHGA